MSPELSLIEDQYEPGSRGRVLRNRLGIKRKRDMDALEAREQLRAFQELLRIYSQKHRFTPQDICRMHKLWLGDIYIWAGVPRQVNISKGAFTFAMASQVAKLLRQFEEGPLKQFTPCHSSDMDILAHALAVVHTELVLIHPFREGNGRVARMLAVLMGLQAGLPPLDFAGIKGAKKQAYFAAVQAGMDYNYQPMEQVFRAVIARSLRAGKKRER
jgi:cell filamentation protein